MNAALARPDRMRGERDGPWESLQLIDREEFQHAAPSACNHEDDCRRAAPTQLGSHCGRYDGMDVSSDRKNLDSVYRLSAGNGER